MSENDYTSDGNWQTLLDQILAQQQGTATNQPVATQTKTTPDNTIAQQTMTTPQDLNTMSPQQVHEAVMNNPNLYSQEALDAYARQNNLGAPPTGGVPYSPTGQNDIATGQSITTNQPTTTGTTYNPSDLIFYLGSCGTWTIGRLSLIPCSNPTMEHLHWEKSPAAQAPLPQPPASKALPTMLPASRTCLPKALM